MEAGIKMMERYEDNDDFSETLFSYHRYLILQKLCANKVVVDMACGTGYGTNILANNAKKIYGFDIDKDSINFCKEKYKNSNIEFSISTVLNIDLEDKTVDVFISCETIEHVVEKEQKKFISEIKRVLKKDGTVVITTPNKERTDMFTVKNPYHLRELYPNDLIGLIKKEFKYYKLFYMDINMVSCIFESNLQQNESAEIIKFSHYNSDSGMSQKPIYMLVVCSNDVDNIKSIASVLYDCEYQFTNYIWNELNQKNILEEKIKKIELEIAKKNRVINYFKRQSKNLTSKTLNFARKIKSQLFRKR